MDLDIAVNINRAIENLCKNNSWLFQNLSNQLYIQAITCGSPYLAKYISHSAKVSKTTVIRKTRRILICIEYSAETFLYQCLLPQTVANDFYAYQIPSFNSDDIFIYSSTLKLHG